MSYSPSNWYWLRDDGALYSSAAQVLVPADDPGYLSWEEAGNRPTRWPEDVAGVQTDAALAEVLAAVGRVLWAPDPVDVLLAYAARRRWELETGGITVAGAQIRTDEQSQANITGGVSLMAADPELAAIDWEAMPGQWVSLDREAMAAIGVAVGRHVQRCFSALRQIQGEITSAPPTITSAEAVDAAFAAALAGA